MAHRFHGKWISDGVLSAQRPRNVFHRQLDKVSIDCTEHRNRHLLFRARFVLPKAPKAAKIYISADDYYGKTIT